MLEFLGTFEDEDLGWVDPFDLLLMEGEDSQQSQTGEMEDDK